MLQSEAEAEVVSESAVWHSGPSHQRHYLGLDLRRRRREKGERGGRRERRERGERVEEKGERGGRKEGYKRFFSIFVTSRKQPTRRKHRQVYQ